MQESANGGAVMMGGRSSRTLPLPVVLLAVLLLSTCALPHAPCVEHTRARREQW